VRVEKIHNRSKEIIPMFGLLWHMNNSHSFKMNVSKGFRAPTIRELYLFPPSNTEIDPEELWNYELGYIYSSDMVSVNSSIFLMKGSNLIRLAGNFPNAAFRNTGEFKHTGLELSVTLKPGRNFSLNLGYTWLDPGDETQYNPGNKVNLRFNYSFERFSLELFSQSLWDRYGSDFAQNRLDQFILFDSRLSYNVSTKLALIAKINNILGDEYQFMEGYPMPGRYFSFGFRFSK